MHYYVLVFKRVGLTDFAMITINHTTDEQEHIDGLESLREYYSNHQEYFIREFKEV